MMTAAVIDDKGIDVGAEEIGVGGNGFTPSVLAHGTHDRLRVMFANGAVMVSA